MEIEVSIIELETERLVGTYLIRLGGLNYTPSDDEFRTEAWKCAVEDGVVNADERDNYRFHLSR
jgi:hypothetical protein